MPRKRANDLQMTHGLRENFEDWIAKQNGVDVGNSPEKPRLISGGASFGGVSVGESR